MTTFDYAAYYRRLQDIKKLQIPAGAVRWTERYAPQVTQVVFLSWAP